MLKKTSLLLLYAFDCICQGRKGVERRRMEGRRKKKDGSGEVTGGNYWRGQNPNSRGG